MTEIVRVERAPKLAYVHVNRFAQKYRDFISLDEAADKSWNDIKCFLGFSVTAQDMFHSTLWLNKLHKYLILYDLRFSKEDHLALIQLCFEGISTRGIDLPLLRKLCRIQKILLKKLYLLSPAEISLDWKPIHDLVLNFYMKESPHMPPHKIRSYKKLILDVVKMCNIYFTPNSTQEIFNFHLPYLCPFVDESMKSSTTLLRHFLPFVYLNGVESVYKIWFDPLLDLWKSGNNFITSWEYEIIAMFCDFATNNIGLVDWSPYLPFFYSRVMKLIKYPITYKDYKPCKYSAISGLKGMAGIIIASLGHTSKGQEFLTKFMGTLTTFFHDSNFGEWSMQIHQFHETLVNKFLIRLKKEKIQKNKWTRQIPDEYQLCDTDIDAFVKSMFLPNVMSERALLGVLSTLAWLRPQMVVPTVLDKFELTIEDLCHPMKRTCALGSITVIAEALVNGSEIGFPEGPTHVVPLLIKILDTVNYHDWGASCSVLRAVYSYFSLIPIVDSSGCTSQSPEEEAVNANSVHYENIFVRSVDIILSLIESLSPIHIRPDGMESGSNIEEEIISASVVLFFHSTLPNMSEDIFSVILDKIKNFILSEFREVNVAGRIIGKICTELAEARPAMTLNALLPPLIDLILNACGADGELGLSAWESEVMYCLSIVNSVVRCGSRDIEFSLPLICSVMDVALKWSARAALPFLGELLGNSLYSLSAVTLKPQPVSSSPTPSPLNKWGLRYHVEDFKLEASFPGEKEESLINKLLNQYVEPQIQLLRRFCTGSAIDRLNLERALTIVLSVTYLENGMPLTDPVDDSLCLHPEEADSLLFNSFNSINVSYTLGVNMHSDLCSLLFSVTSRLIECDEDDSNSLLLIIMIASSLMRFKPVTSRKNSSRLTVCFPPQLKKNLYFDRKLTKNILVNRILSKKRSFLEYSSDLIPSNSHAMLVDVLFRISISRYCSVRCEAQSALSELRNVMTCIPYLVAPHVEDALMTHPKLDSPTFKGLNYLAQKKVYSLTDQPVLKSQIWLLLINGWTVTVDETHIGSIRMFGSLLETDQILKWNFSWSESFRSLAWDLWLKIEIPRIPPLSNDEVHQCEIDFRENCRLAIRKLKSLRRKIVRISENAESPLHWRFEVLCLAQLKNLCFFDESYLDEKLIKYPLARLLHDNVCVRNEALECCSYFMYCLKDTTFTFRKIPITDLIQPIQSDEVFGEDSRTDTLQYDTSPLIHNGEEIFCHKPSYGFAGWPEFLKCPILNSQNCELSTVISSEFSLKHAEFILAMQTSRTKTYEDFNVKNYNFHKMLFVYCPELISLYVNLLDSLVSAADEVDHGVASEIIAGIADAIKYQPIESQNATWDLLIPRLQEGIKLDSPAALNIYGEAFSTICGYTDPKVLRRVFDFLTDFSIEENNFSSVIFRQMVYLISAIKPCVAWKMANLNHALLKKIVPFLDHQYQTIRNGLSGLLGAIFAPDISFGGSHKTRSPRVKQFLNEVVFPRLDVYDLSDDALDTQDKKKQADKLLITVCRWIVSTVNKYPFIHEDIYRLVTILPRFDNGGEDSELTTLSQEVLGILACKPLMPEQFKATIDIIGLNVSFHEFIKTFSWKTRISWLKFLQIFCFYNLPNLFVEPVAVKNINDIVLFLLQDEHIETRISAGEVLKDLVHCGISQDVNSLKALFEGKLKGLDLSSNEYHGAILGLIALVNANPYTVPPYMDSVINCLITHLHDPHPVSDWINASFTSFKRTHLACWKEEVEQKLNPETILLLSESRLTYFT